MMTKDKACSSALRIHAWGKSFLLAISQFGLCLIKTMNKYHQLDMIGALTGYKV